MYFMYRNNLHMFYANNEIVIKTWNKNFKIKGDENLFQSINRVIGILCEPKTYEDLIASLIIVDQKNLSRILKLLLKVKVIIYSENKDIKSQSIYVRYDDIEKLMINIQESNICFINIPQQLKLRIFEYKININNCKEEYLLINFDGVLDNIIDCYKNYKNMYKKIIIYGEFKGHIYIICCDDKTNDLRKLIYNIEEKCTNDENLVLTQNNIAQYLIENKIIDFFYSNNDTNNFTIIYPDLTVRNQMLNFNIIKDNINKELICNPYRMKDEEKILEKLDIPLLDTYVNQLPFVGYFGSRGYEQFPLPVQVLILIDKDGKQSANIYQTGDNYLNTVLNTLKRAISYFYKYEQKKNSIFSMHYKRNTYYFEGIAAIVFTYSSKVVEIYKFNIKDYIIDVKNVAHLNIYQVQIIKDTEIVVIYDTNISDLIIKLNYTIIGIEKKVQESLNIVKKIENILVSISKKEVIKDLWEINYKCIIYLRQEGIYVYEKQNAYSQEFLSKGIYMGEFIGARKKA